MADQVAYANAQHLYIQAAMKKNRNGTLVVGDRELERTFTNGLNAAHDKFDRNQYQLRVIGSDSAVARHSDLMQAFVEYEYDLMELARAFRRNPKNCYQSSLCLRPMGDSYKSSERLDKAINKMLDAFRADMGAR